MPHGHRRGVSGVGASTHLWPKSYAIMSYAIKRSRSSYAGKVSSQEKKAVPVWRAFVVSTMVLSWWSASW